jgi:hypothetical protein
VRQDDERTRAVAALDAVRDLGDRLARDHHLLRVPVAPDSFEAVLLTLFAAAHRSAGAAADLLRHGWADEAQVHGRSLFEHVVYAHLMRLDDQERLRFVHFGSSLGRWDELDEYLQVFPDTSEEDVAAVMRMVHEGCARAVIAFGLLHGETHEARQTDLDSLMADPDALYERLRKGAFPRHVRGRRRAWCSRKSLYHVIHEVDAAHGTSTFLTLYRLVYGNANRVVHCDPSIVGRVRTDDPTALLMGPDPNMTIPTASAVGQLLIGMDELVNDALQLNLEQQLKASTATFTVVFSQS